MTCIRHCLSLGVLALATASVAAQAVDKVQPNRIRFGDVHVGAIAEASFLVYVQGNDPKIPLTVTAPKFVKVRNAVTHTQQFGKDKDVVGGAVDFVLDTSVAGDLTGEVSVKLGEATVKIPVTATVKPARKGQSRLLVVETPFEKYATENGDDYKPWTNLVKAASLDVSYLGTTPDKLVLRDLDLSKFDTILLASTGLVYLHDADVARVRKFAEAGGRVVVCANAFYRNTVEKANLVLDGYGVQIRDEEARIGPNDVTLDVADFDTKLVVAGIKSARFFRASPVAITNDKTGRVLVKAVVTGKEGDGFVATAKAGKGEVIAFGQSLWWHSITDAEARNTDNARLLQWLLVPSREK